MMEEKIEIFEEEQINYASFWERFAAVIIDSVIIGIIYGVLSFVISDDFLKPSMEVSILRLVIGAAYNTILNSSYKQGTFGKQAMNIKVTSRDGVRISFLNAFGRFLATYVSMIILGIGYLMMLWDDKKQCLHDKIASTLVVKS